jgi:hypothetical protein
MPLLIPPAQKIDGIAPELMAAMTASFLGGGTSARLIRQPVPTVLADRTGDYVRCASAMGLRDLYTCEKIETDEVDPESLRDQCATPL